MRNQSAAVDHCGFLCSTAGATAAVAGGMAMMATPSPAAEISGAPDIDALLSAYLAEAKHLRELKDASSAAEARMPAWARPGPLHLLHDGTKGGGVTGWPEVADLPNPPERSGVCRVIRPSIKGVWASRTMMLGGVSLRIQNPDGSITVIPPTSAALATRRRQRLAAFAAVRKVIVRLRERDEERRKVGLPQLEVAIGASVARLSDLEGDLCAARPGPVLPTLVARLVFEQFHCEDAFSRSALELAAPTVAGQLRAVVDDLLARGEGSIHDTLLAGGEGFA